MSIKSKSKRKTLRRKLSKQFKYCFYCGVEFDKDYATLEHVIPNSYGGIDHICNVRLTHSGCNHTRQRLISTNQGLYILLGKGLYNEGLKKARKCANWLSNFDSQPTIDYFADFEFVFLNPSFIRDML